jgi:threonine dehydrogenase-like Zn-dependent dehydrogenase
VRALTWHGRRDVRIDEVPDPAIQEPTDAIVRITTTAICGSDLHLYEVMSPFLEEGDVLGHEPMGFVEEVGPEVTQIKPGDRVVVPFQVACGHCFMCDQGLHTQCETTQVRDQGMGAALLGYSKLYGQVPGGQAELLRACAYPTRSSGRSRSPRGLPTSASSISPTSSPRRGRRSSTRPSPTVAAWPSWAWGRSATCPRASPCIAATA